MPVPQESVDALVIGGGPAGLMAADALLSAGRRVVLTEQKPSLARKFLMAGKSGLNLTKAEDTEACLAAYGAAAELLRPMIEALPPEAIAAWAEGLGQRVFTGSTGRVFPQAMKASPLLRTWLARLAEFGLETRTRWRWVGWEKEAALFDTPDGAVRLAPIVTVLACGGASWARLGSDGRWADPVGAEGMPIAPFAPANAGLRVDWSAHIGPHFGAPLKNIGLGAGRLASRGEVVISESGLEGGGLYPLSPALRDGAPLTVDLAPDVAIRTLAARLRKGAARESAANRLRKAARLSPQARALVMECARPLPREAEALAALLKALEIPHRGLAPLDEAISTAGGLRWDGLTERLELIARPGVYAAGEMLDWEAPTGGYLLTACLATGLWAGRCAAEHRA